MTKAQALSILSDVLEAYQYTESPRKYQEAKEALHLLGKDWQPDIASDEITRQGTCANCHRYFLQCSCETFVAPIDPAQ